MKSVGIEAMNAFCGTAYVNVNELAKYRKLDMARFDNLLMNEKSVALPYEDPVSLAVNAAKPIIDALSNDEKNRIEMVITCTESSFDFGKSMSTYVHHLLGLNRNCRLFELKSACHSGVTGLQMAINFILSGVSPGAKVLVLATDISRFMAVEGGDALSEDWSFSEPSSGAGATAVLVSENPDIFKIDVGANGYYSYEVMDTCRPIPDSEAGNSDLSLMSYLDCYEKAFEEYKKRVSTADYKDSFSYLIFHTPFGGMVKGAHRKAMRKFYQAKADEIEEDFNVRVMPGLKYCQRVGNIMGATTMLSLISTIENGVFNTPRRIGCFSYGSGCSSEFFSGIVTNQAQKKLRELSVVNNLDQRRKLSMDEYQSIIDSSGLVKFGTRNVKLDMSQIKKVQNSRLYLREINEYHRKYEWL
ncbi:MAG: hydroxymethylglutaryl-CoA synthase family protein [Gammaproteobacteria bacterium]|nr:MAG: hydroxymethylglutaryl-CoA synthase family protein [Gammaproteobacteria bacterium]